jgi:XTP/dITP diphosphohydrolase
MRCTDRAAEKGTGGALKELVVATRNFGKLREIEALLAQYSVRVLSVLDFPDLPEVDEDGDTFEANALKKARTIASCTGRLTLADDSGLEVETLGGMPGVNSARYAGVNATDEENTFKLLKELEWVPKEKRQGAFRCVMALCSPDGTCNIFSGRLDGMILENLRGAGGFGYDPVFFVPDFGKTLAELSTEVKNRISHRGQALRKLLEFFDLPAKL